MNGGNLIIEVKDGTEIITLNRPKVLNALNWDVVSELGYVPVAKNNE